MEQLYVRIRGRVMGPYDQEKLASLVRRGQLGRLHEVSEDGVAWVRATQYPDLFVPAAQTTAGYSAPAAAKAVSTPKDENAVHIDGTGPALPTWHYTSASTQQGPVDFPTLQKLVASGQLGPADLVWTEGMTEWVSPRAVPSLAGLPGLPIAKQIESSEASRSGELPPAVVRALRASRPWLLFIAIFTYVYAALSIVGGLVLLMVGSSSTSPIVVAQGIFSIIAGIIEGIAAWMLTVYGSRIQVTIFRNDFDSLEAALDRLRLFWVYVGILLIVFLAFAVVIGVWVLAIGGTLASVLPASNS